MLAWRETGGGGSWWAAEGGADVWVYGVSGMGVSAGHATRVCRGLPAGLACQFEEARAAEAR